MIRQRRHLFGTTALVAVLLAMLPAPSAWASPALPAPPPVSAPVVDGAGILSAGTIRALDEQLGTDNGSTVAQIAVLTEDAIPGPIAAYARAVFDHWGIGGARSDDGVLLLVAVDDRQVRIQTGSGLGARLPSSAAARIIATDAVPELREGDDDAGVLMTVVAIRRDLGLPPSTVLRTPGGGAGPAAGGGAGPAAVGATSRTGGGSDGYLTVFVWLGAAILVLGGIARLTGRGRRGPPGPGHPPGGYWGGMTGGGMAGGGMAGGDFGGGASGGGGATGSW